MAAIAEYLYGGERTSNNLIVIKIEQGIGAGVVLNGQLFYGDGMGAGEIGHLVVAERGEPCVCGNYGCLETISSTRSLLHGARQIAAIQPTSALASEEVLSLKGIRQAAEAGDEAARKLLLEAGRALGVALASLVAGFNIHQVVFAGSITDLGEWIVGPVLEVARQRALPALAEQTSLHLSTLGEDIVILGCAAMILTRELGII
jgi:predicted NBD/HSP70 family sugar kinase